MSLSRAISQQPSRLLSQLCPSARQLYQSQSPFQTQNGTQGRGQESPSPFCLIRQGQPLSRLSMMPKERARDSHRMSSGSYSLATLRVSPQQRKYKPILPNRHFRNVSLSMSPLILHKLFHRLSVCSYQMARPLSSIKHRSRTTSVPLVLPWPPPTASLRFYCLQMRRATSSQRTCSL